MGADTFDGSEAAVTEQKKVYYAGGWKPTHTVHSKFDANAPPQHFAIGNYCVLRNDAHQYTWQIKTSVTHPYDVTLIAWAAEANECEVKIDGQNLVIVRKGEEYGITMKLPKSADLNASVIVEGEKYTLLVTIPKIGATLPPRRMNTAPLLDAFVRGADGKINSPELEMKG